MERHECETFMKVLRKWKMKEFKRKKSKKKKKLTHQIRGDYQSNVHGAFSEESHLVSDVDS